MALSTTETIGLTNQFVQLLEDNKSDLQEKGLDISNWIMELKNINSETVANDAAQDDMKAALKSKTAETQGLVKRNYKMTSSRLDAVIGVLGKDTPFAKQAARLRSSLIKQSKSKTGGKVKT